MSQMTSSEVEPRMKYASMAARYWATYLPSRLETIPVDQRQEFFTDLGRQVAEMVDYLAKDNLRASSRPHDPTELTARNIRSTSAPSRSGSPRSRITRSGRALTARRMPSMPVGADATACPRSPSARTSLLRTSASSSTSNSCATAPR